MNRLVQAALPSWVVFQLEERCNLRCAMCYQWGDAGSYREQPGLARLDRRLLTRTIEECLPGNPVFEFFGGEPLLYPGIWEAIERIRNAGCRLSFSTNGTLLGKVAPRLVECSPTRLWISLDGPREINDLQRGRGVHRRVLAGLEALAGECAARSLPGPGIGLTTVITPLNHHAIERFVHDMVERYPFEAVSLELQSHLSASRVQAYARLAREHFGVADVPGARGYLRDPAHFDAIDVDALAGQLASVAETCRRRGIAFHSQPMRIDAVALARHLGRTVVDARPQRSRCAMPWSHAEITARGQVSICHGFHDITIGDLTRDSLRDIWNGERAWSFRQAMREALPPICVACCRYHQ